MSIFNSLGSNYSWRFMFQSLFTRGSADANISFEKILGEHYQGRATLTYKGREALELALRRSGLPAGSTVGINGFTCYVVWRAVVNAGYRPVMIDPAVGQLDFGAKELEQAASAAGNLKAVIIQNTLGYPVDIKALEAYCAKHKIMIIEDLAHSFGAVYAGGREAGTVGDLVMFSFSQDKPLDVVAGGAMVDRRKHPRSEAAELTGVSWWQGEINRDYPFWTGLIRTLYASGLGRGLHFLLKKARFLATPMGDAGAGPHRMSGSTAKLILARWDHRQAELKHRQSIAAIYERELPAKVRFIQKPNGQPSYLRFPLWVDDRASLVKYLKKRHVYIGDTWYDAPIAPKRYLAETDYVDGSCPRSEKLSRHIVNLPTHGKVSQQQAGFIAAEVNKWLKTSK